MQVNFVRTPSHSGIVGNELDGLANSGAKKNKTDHDIPLSLECLEASIIEIHDNKYSEHMDTILRL